MKRLEQLTHHVTVRSGIIVAAAMMVLVSVVNVRTARGSCCARGDGCRHGVDAGRRGRKQRHRHPAVPRRGAGGGPRDLRRRSATRWPDKETVADQSQGAQLAKLQELVRYWGTDYDWRKAEAKLNAFPQFMTTIDGVDIHFIHVRSRHPNALPLIITHGWPGSVFEQIKLIGPLTDPTAYGGRAEDAFDVVIPSLPGFGFSSRPTEAGWGLERIGRAWDVLMKRLGYTRYVAQGGDWGAGVVEAMGRQAPEGLLGIHTNLPAAFPPDVGAAIASGGPAPAGLSEKERAESTPCRRSSRTAAGLPGDDGRAAAGRRLRPDGLPRRPRGVHARARRVRQVDVRQGPQTVADAETRCWTTSRCTG